MMGNQLFRYKLLTLLIILFTSLTTSENNFLDQQSDSESSGESTMDLSINSTFGPSISPSNEPTMDPTINPTFCPSISHFDELTHSPNEQKMNSTINPIFCPSISPSNEPTHSPSNEPTMYPTINPTFYPSISPSNEPTHSPSNENQSPASPSSEPSWHPTMNPTINQTYQPTEISSSEPSSHPTMNATINQIYQSTESPSSEPSSHPTMNRTIYTSYYPTINSSQLNESSFIVPTVTSNGSPKLNENDQIVTSEPSERSESFIQPSRPIEEHSTFPPSKKITSKNLNPAIDTGFSKSIYTVYILAVVVVGIITLIYFTRNFCFSGRPSTVNYSAVPVIESSKNSSKRSNKVPSSKDIELARFERMSSSSNAYPNPLLAKTESSS